MPKISVIVPVYNVEPYIHRCVDSILNQTFTDFELILVDDGSPDNCGKICDEYAEKDNRVRVIHQENGGLSAARNAGIDWVLQNSESEWLTFIDSDDWVDRKYLQFLYDAAKLHNADISCCGFSAVSDYIPETVKKSYDIVCGTAEELIPVFDSYSAFNLSVAWGRLYKTHCFNDIRFPLGRLHEDEYIVYKILLECKMIAVAKENLYYYFQNNSGITGSEITAKRLNDKLDALLEKTRYLYNSKHSSLFYSSFCYYCRRVEELTRKYRNNKELKKVLKKHEKHICNCLSAYRDNLPEEIKSLGYKKWAKAPYFEQFGIDLNNIKKNKGFLFSLLWAAKNYWRI